MSRKSELRLSVLNYLIGKHAASPVSAVSGVDFVVTRGITDADYNQAITDLESLGLAGTATSGGFVTAVGLAAASDTH